MGANLALQAVEKNIAVIGKARSKRPELEIEGVKVVDNYKDFVSFLEHPGVIYLSLPDGPMVDTVLTELTPYLEKGDVVIDGAILSIWILSDEMKGCLPRGFIFSIVERAED
jgi:6-phosphogluconate dehydrogenase